MPDIQIDEKSQKILEEFFTLYKEEQERENLEQDKQNIINSEQNEILAKEKIEKKEQEKKDLENEKQENERLQIYRQDVISNLREINSREGPTSDDFQKLNTNIEKLITYEKRNDTANINNQFLNSTLVFGMIVSFSVYVMFKTVKPLISNISRLMFRI